MTSLQGKVIALTGAASGIGKATAYLLASRGATLCLADIHQEPLDAIAEDIRSQHASIRVLCKAVNVVKASEVASWLDEVMNHLGKIDGAANLAGISGCGGLKSITELSDEDWDTVMDVNLKGVFNSTRAELQRMNKNGSIVNISSVAGLKGVKNSAAYCTSKVAYSQSVAVHRLTLSPSSMQL